MSGRARRGQSFAIKDIPEGKPFISLGDPIGLASVSLQPGDPVNEAHIQRRRRTACSAGVFRWGTGYLHFQRHLLVHDELRTGLQQIAIASGPQSWSDGFRIR